MDLSQSTDLSLSTNAENEPAPDTNWRECPNCYEIYDYSRSGNPDLLPRLLYCRHLVCSLCASELLIESGICCPTCMEMSDCSTIQDLPIPAFSPLCSPSSKKNSFSTDSLKADGESDGSMSSMSSNKSSSANKLRNFIVSSPYTARVLSPSELKHHSKKTTCLMESCNRKRGAGRYFCDVHQDKARRVTWRSAERLVERYQNVSHYRHSTGAMDKNGLLMQELGPEPSLERLNPSYLVKLFSAQESLAMGEAMWLIDESIRIFSKEPNVLRLEAPMCIVGDLHGQFFDLLSMLNMCNPMGEKSQNLRLESKYLFLGDYVDRGAFSCEVMLFLLSLKLCNPRKVYMLRGNHECRSLTGHFGFKDECKNKYGLPVYYRFLKLFESLPLCALVSGDLGQYFCAHGGISPELYSIDEIDKIERRSEPQMSGILCDILWSDPADDPGVSTLPEKMTSAELETLLGENYSNNPLRGCSVVFGYAAAVRFLENNNLLCLIRAHAVQEGGYYRHFEEALKWCRDESNKMERNDDFFDRENNYLWEVLSQERPLPPVITVFSAPNYCGRYGNKGAILKIERDTIEPIFIQYDCVPSPKPKVGAKSLADMHITALIEACPYMPSTFRDFVTVAGRMGPAQPLQGAKMNDDASTAAIVCGPAVAEATAKFEAKSRKFSLQHHRADSFAAVVGATGEETGPMTTHVMYRAMIANDRINERHPDALFDNQDERVLNKAGSVNEMTKRLNVQALLRRFEPDHGSPVLRNWSRIKRNSPKRTVTPMTFDESSFPQRIPSTSTSVSHDTTLMTEFIRSPTLSDANDSSLVNSPISPIVDKVPWISKNRSSIVKERLSSTPPMSPSPLQGNLFLQKKLGSPERRRKQNMTLEKNESRKNNIIKLSSPRYKTINGVSWNKKNMRQTYPIDSECDIDNDINSPNRGKSSASNSPRRTRTSPLRKSPLKKNSRTSESDALLQHIEADEFTFSEKELLGLKLLFALMDYNDQKYIDANALQMYAGEHDDFAQAAEVQACIDAVDVDGDGKIGLMDFLSSAARLKNVYEMSLAQEVDQNESILDQLLEEAIPVDD